MNKELKPCPFCGGKAQLDHDGGILVKSYVRCMECHARTTAIAIASYHCSDDKAVELWNHRAGEESCDVRKNIKGEWLHDEVTMNGNTVYTPNAKCSICDCYVFQESNFCPNCGAEMRKGG